MQCAWCVRACVLLLLISIESLSFVPIVHEMRQSNTNKRLRKRDLKTCVYGKVRQATLRILASAYGLGTYNGSNPKSKLELTEDILKYERAQKLRGLQDVIDSLNRNEDADTIERAVLAAADKKGKGMGEEKGLYGKQIDHIMREELGHRAKLWAGVYASDQLLALALKLKPTGKISFIRNLDKSDGPGTHWVTVYINTLRDRALEYYDSFGREPTREFMAGIHDVIGAMELETYLKFKVNRIIQQ